MGVQKFFAKFFFYYCFVFKLHLESGGITGLCLPSFKYFNNFPFSVGSKCVLFR